MLYLVKKLGLGLIVSIDYSLSPEVQFPTALFECERVLAELHKEKCESEIIFDRITRG
jgi:acetyl esterase/lipase